MNHRQLPIFKHRPYKVIFSYLYFKNPMLPNLMLTIPIIHLCLQLCKVACEDESIILFQRDTVTIEFTGTIVNKLAPHFCGIQDHMFSVYEFG